MDYSTLRERAEGLKPELVYWRRLIHQNPELGLAEHETAALVAKSMASWGLEVKTGIAGTGVTGLLRGGKGSIVLLRADMDALPLQEETGLEFSSRRPGVMHACGHDAHVAMLLGAARLLSDGDDELSGGGVKFVFQPNEETLPGGAPAMIREGVLEEPKVAVAFALHVNPYLPVGVLGLKEGAVMAAADMFQLTLEGEGGHGASPHQTVDAVVVAAAVIQALQTVVSRRLNPVDPAVLTIGTVNGGTKSNVIASRVVMTGTVRTVFPEQRQQVPAIMEQVIAGVASSFGARYSLDYQWGYPPTVNDPGALAVMRQAALKVLGPKKTFRLNRVSMGGEDFAYFGEHVPAAYCYLGVGRPEGKVYPWHHSRFDIHEDALCSGSALLAAAALEYLKGEVINGS